MAPSYKAQARLAQSEGRPTPSVQAPHTQEQGDREDLGERQKTCATTPQSEPARTALFPFHCHRSEQPGRKQGFVQVVCLLALITSGAPTWH
jgi:hypothetical protein